MKGAGQVVELDEFRELPASAATISPASSRSSGGISASPSAAKRSASVRQAIDRFSPVRAYSFKDNPRAMLRRRIAILWAFEPVK